MDVNAVTLPPVSSQTLERLLSPPPEAGAPSGTGRSDAPSAVLDFSSDARTLKALQIAPHSLEVISSRTSLHFSLTQLFESGSAESHGSVAFGAQVLDFRFQMETEAGKFSLSLSLGGVTQGSGVDAPVPPDKQFEKVVQEIVEAIQREIRQNPDADMNELAVAIMRKHLQPFFSVLRHLINFLFKLGQAQDSPSGSPFEAIQEAKGTPVLNLNEDLANVEFRADFEPASIMAPKAP